MGGVPISVCNKFVDFPIIEEIRKYFYNLGYDVLGGTLHKSAELFCSYVTAFYGHFDKVAFGTTPIIFVALEGAFTVLVATPGIRPCYRWNNEEAMEWTRVLSEDEREEVLSFVAQFAKEAGCEISEVSMFTVRPGDFLAFDATAIFHAVLIHPHPQGLRQLLLLHGLLRVAS